MNFANEVACFILSLILLVFGDEMYEKGKFQLTLQKYGPWFVTQIVNPSEVTENKGQGENVLNEL